MGARHSRSSPVLGFVGPHLGRHPGWVTTQSEVLSELFAADGFAVHAASSIRQPVARAADMLLRTWRWRGRVDVVSISVFSGRAFRIADWTSRVAHSFGLPVVLVLHGGDLPQLVERRPAWLGAVFSRAAAIVAPSEFLARTGRRLGFEVEVIPNVLDLDAYRHRHRRRLPEPGRPLRLLWMRTFHPIYRPELALSTLAVLRARGVDARLTLAGQDKGRLEPCRRRASELGLADVVEFPGFLDPRAKARTFDEHDVFLNTNRVDNTPVTVLEAMASGLPVVAMAAGGLPDLLDQGARGELVPESGSALAAGGSSDSGTDRNASRLAERILTLVESPERVAELSAAGRAWAETSAWPRVRERWLALFERVRCHAEVDRCAL